MSYGSIAEKVYVYQVAVRRGNAGPHFLEADAIASSIDAATNLMSAFCATRSIDWTYRGQPIPGTWYYHGTNGCEFHITEVEVDAPLKN